ncbi:MAG: hypothetical protein NUW02_01265 [Candidatus Campbellbacteria bacterium]|nr:hypothetical protein [Candidatus Campbellbacteria bacterium]
MKFEESSISKEQRPNSEVYTKEYERIKTWLLKLFKDKNEEEIEGLYSEIQFLVSAIGEDPSIIIEKIKKGWNQEDPEEFVAIVFGATKKYIDQKIEHPEIFEEIRRERRIQRFGTIKLSELMYYSLDLQNGVAIIHVEPKGNLGFGGILKSFRDGMKELAKQAKKDERIKEIKAMSWIVASNPGLLEKAGFIVDGPMDEKTKVQHFGDEERPVSVAHMSRETLLEKYLG